MSDTTARLALPIMLPAQAQKHVTHNEALEKLDLVAQLTLEAFDALTPPTNPLDGQIWALGASPSGVWAGQGGRLAAYRRNSWEFLTPNAGWTASAGSNLRVFDGSDWVFPQLDALQNLPGLGINTSFDATNRLAVAAEATLLTHEGAGHQVKINKAAASNTASLLFQTEWSGRAEMGTAGEDDFAIKVSADGTNWHVAARADRATGHLEMPNGASIDGLLTGTSVTQSTTDGTEGRLMKVGDFGLGGDGDMPTITDWNDLRPTGFYRDLSLSTPNQPIARRFNSITVNRGLGRIAELSMAVDSGFSEPRIFARAYAASWGPWRQLYHQGDILGTVSQSGGVPTGAAWQGNANASNPSGGYSERMAGGFQTVHHTLTTSTSANSTWTYSSAFLNGSAPVICIQPVGDSELRVRVVSRTATACVFSVRDASGNRVAVPVDLLARGRWSNMT